MPSENPKQKIENSKRRVKSYFTFRLFFVINTKCMNKFQKKACFSENYVVYFQSRMNYDRKVGVDDVEGTPVPIPNTEVKLNGAEDTLLVTTRKNRKMPT